MKWKYVILILLFPNYFPSNWLLIDQHESGNSDDEDKESLSDDEDEEGNITKY